jgi:DNA replication protein
LVNNGIYHEFSQALFFAGQVPVPAILLDSYADMGLTAEEMMFLIHTIPLGAGWQKELSPEEIARQMGISVTELRLIMASLEKKRCLQITAEEADLTCFDLGGLVDQLQEVWGIRHYLREAPNQKQPRQNLVASPVDKGEAAHVPGFSGQEARVPSNLSSRQDAGVPSSKSEDKPEAALIKCFEQEFGKELTGFECEQVVKWLEEGHKPELVLHALRKAVLQGVRTWKYIDGILRDWQGKHLQSILEVEREDEFFRSQKKTRKSRGTKKESAKKEPVDEHKYDYLYLN